MDFYYGSHANFLWDAFEQVFGSGFSFIHELRQANPPLPYPQARPLFESALASVRLGIADTLLEFYRLGQSSADKDLYALSLNPRLLSYLASRPNIEYLFCSSTHVTAFLQQRLIQQGNRLQLVQTDKLSFQFQSSGSSRIIKVLQLASPSPAAAKNYSLDKSIPAQNKRGDRRIDVLAGIYRQLFTKTGFLPES